VSLESACKQADLLGRATQQSHVHTAAHSHVTMEARTEKPR